MTAVLLIVSVIGFAQMPPVKRGSTVYIEPMDGDEAYIAGAFQEKQVPLIIVTDKSKAEYIVRSKVIQTQPNQPAVVVNNTNVNGGSANSAWDQGWALGGNAAARRAAATVYTSTSVNLIDAQSSQIVFAHSAGKGGLKGTAEDCAKHLKAFIEKPPK